MGEGVVVLSGEAARELAARMRLGQKSISHRVIVIFISSSVDVLYMDTGCGGIFVVVSVQGMCNYLFVCN
jgi:hypothetical protein